jgi:glutathione S-transferase
MREISAYTISKNAKGIHLITMNTPNGQAVQVLLEELKDAYGTEWTTTVIDIMTNEQKKEWLVRINWDVTLVLIRNSKGS